MFDFKNVLLTLRAEILHVTRLLQNSMAILVKAEALGFAVKGMESKQCKEF
jgi:hypothetical protein